MNFVRSMVFSLLATIAALCAACMVVAVPATPMWNYWVSPVLGIPSLSYVDMCGVMAALSVMNIPVSVMTTSGTSGIIKQFAAKESA